MCDAAEGRAAGVDGPGVVREERAANRAADTIGGDDEVGLEFSAGEADSPVFVDFGDFGAGLEAFGRDGVLERGDQVFPVDGAEGTAVEAFEGVGVEAGDLPAAFVPEPAFPFWGEVFCQVDTQFVEAAQSVRPE